MSLMEEALTKRERGKELENKKDKVFTLPSEFSSKKSFFLKVKKGLFITFIAIGVLLGLIFLKNFFVSYCRKPTETMPKKALNKVKTKAQVSAKDIVSTAKKSALPPKTNTPPNSQPSLVRTKTSKPQIYYTVQIGTFRKLQGAKKFFNLVSCAQKRIEKINGFYVVRCGLFQDKHKAISLKRHLKEKFNDVIVISTFPPSIIKSRTILKQAEVPNQLSQKGNQCPPNQPGKKTSLSSAKIPTYKVKRRAKLKAVVKKTRHKVNIKKINALLKKAYFYLEAKQVAQALNVYNKILEMDPWQTEALLNRGIIWQKLGEFKKAQDDFLKALKIKPNDPDLLNALGVNYLKLGQFKKAEEFFLKAGNAKAMINLAILYWQRGKFEKVITYLNKALVLSPDDPYVHYYLGLYYQGRQDWTKANKEFSLCKQLAEEKGVFELLNKLKEKVY